MWDGRGVAWLVGGREGSMVGRQRLLVVSGFGFLVSGFWFRVVRLRGDGMLWGLNSCHVRRCC